MTYIDHVLSEFLDRWAAAKTVGVGVLALAPDVLIGRLLTLTCLVHLVDVLDIGLFCVPCTTEARAHSLAHL